MNNNTINTINAENTAEVMELNAYAEIINENRGKASSQLTADDMSPKTWLQYRRLCDTLAKSAWASIVNHETDEEVGLALTGLFAFFGSNAKATGPIKRRFITACVAIKTERSDEMKAARRTLSTAKKALDVAKEAGKSEEIITAKTNSVKEAEAEVERLKGISWNEYLVRTPMLDSTKMHASAKCRKIIEDTMSDLFLERSLMTTEELEQEALQLKAERKARKQMKAIKKAEANTEAQA